MPGFIIADFGGMSTALAPKTLKANIATYAKNCEVGDGQLKPLKGTGVVTPLATSQTFAVTAVGGNFIISSVANKALTLKVGSTYIFTYPSGHPFRFSTTVDGTHGSGSEYTTGVTHDSSTQSTIVVSDSTPTALYYYCSSHSGMGGNISVVTPSLLATSPQTIYEYVPGYWFEFGVDVDVARVPNAFDITNKVVFTGDTYPKITRDDVALGAAPMPVGAYRLGLPAPTVAAVASIVGSAVADALDDYRTYLYTWVDGWDQESTISPISNTINVKEGQTASLVLPSFPSGNYNAVNARLRIYRSNSGTSATNFQQVMDVASGVTPAPDNVLAAGLGEVIPTVDWLRPPDDDTSDFPTGQMLGATTLPSGSIVGFSGKTLVYSEVYVPYAFPLNYRYHLKDDIVGISPNSQGLVIATTGKPHLAVGHDPASVSIIELDEFQACVSKRSVVDMGESTIYASPDGLVLVSGSQVQIVTKGIFNREQWQAINPSQIHAYRYEGKYVGFTDTQGFMFDPASTEQAWVFTDIAAACGFYSAKDDILYVADGSALKKWETGSDLTYTWKSKTFESPTPMNLGAISVACAGTVSVKIYGDDVLRATVSCTDDTLSRLPAGYTATEWRVELEGTAHVDYVKLATSVKELATVV